MTGASAWFPCYPNDLLGSIRWKRMTPAQRGAYWQLICWQMQSDDGHFDNDVGLLSALADLDLSNGNSIVVESFPVQENGRRANARALKEWAKRRAISKTRSTVGKAGIAKRWDKDSKPIANAIAIGTTTTTTTTTRKPQPEKQDNTAAKRRGSFVPPTAKEVTDYSREIGYPLDGQAWCDKYQQKDWMVGKTRMKDWKAAVRNWKSSGWATGPAATKPTQRNFI